MKYLLPCSCGRKLRIHTSQAGERIPCGCGADLEVPTMREIALLEQDRSEPVAPPPPRRWGIRQRLLLAGAALVLMGGFLGAASYFLRPVLAPVADYPPWMALDLWVVLQSGVDRPAHPAELGYEEALHIHRQWMGVAAALAVLGLLTMASSRLVGRVVVARPRPGGNP